jgi:hypothetical protein
MVTDGSLRSIQTSLTAIRPGARTSPYNRINGKGAYRAPLRAAREVQSKRLHKQSPTY